MHDQAGAIKGTGVTGSRLGGGKGWNEELNAQLYAAFAESHPMYRVTREESFIQLADPAELHAWLSIPIFAATRLPGLAADVRAGVLDRALRACDLSIRSERVWDCFLCRRTGAAA